MNIITEREGGLRIQRNETQVLNKKLSEDKTCVFARRALRTVSEKQASVYSCVSNTRGVRRTNASRRAAVTVFPVIRGNQRAVGLHEPHRSVR